MSTMGLTTMMTSRQCEIAAESYTACLLAQCGYDVLVQYGAKQPHYDLVAVKDKRIHMEFGSRIRIRFISDKYTMCQG